MPGYCDAFQAHILAGLSHPASVGLNRLNFTVTPNRKTAADSCGVCVGLVFDVCAGFGGRCHVLPVRRRRFKENNGASCGVFDTEEVGAGALYESMRLN